MLKKWTVVEEAGYVIIVDMRNSLLPSGLFHRHLPGSLFPSNGPMFVAKLRNSESRKIYWRLQSENYTNNKIAIWCVPAQKASL
jgi:hypothetical protein